jgi:ADP-heptose:LPS heptosyltransferase
MSMTAISHTTLETIPAHIPYLRADAERAAERVAELALSLDQPSVGLAWAGNPSYRADKDRSTQLSTLLPLLQAFPEISFVSLQKGDAAAQIVSLPHGVSLIDGCREDADLADTAALLANLDLVITTDTVIAHLAGAMGKPLWLLLPWQSDWRWMQQLSTTPWYPHARLWRQTAPGDWEELITRVSQALAELSFPKAAVHSC